MDGRAQVQHVRLHGGAGKCARARVRRRQRGFCAGGRGQCGRRAASGLREKRHHARNRGPQGTKRDLLVGFLMMIFSMDC